MDRFLYWFITRSPFEKAAVVLASLLAAMVFCCCGNSLLAPPPESGDRASVHTPALTTTIATVATSTLKTGAPPSGIETPVPIATIILTETPQPTNTPSPTDTPTPTDTSQPTSTPTSTRTPTPSPTVIPATATAQALETAAAESATGTAVARVRREATATAQAVALATVAIEAYRVKPPPSGLWYSFSERVGVAVWDFRYTKRVGYTAAAKGSKFVAFFLDVRNESGSAISVNPNDVTLVDLDGYTYAYDFATFDYWSQPFPGVEVQDGNNAEGGIVFLIPADTGPAQIIFQTGLLFQTKVVIDLRRPPDEKQ